MNRVPVDAYYTEGLLVGYRWFDTKGIEPLYAFGHGLSYVDFEYSNIRARAGKDAVTVTFDLTNRGDMEADEVAQLYVRYQDSAVERPEKELKAFQRVTVAPGETVKVKLSFDLDDLRWWNEESGGWDLEHGTLDLLLGSASDDIRLTAEVNL